MVHHNTRRLQEWLNDCLSYADIEMIAAHNLKDGIGREVWDATIEIGSKRKDVVLSIFNPCPLDCINTNLPPAPTVMKCALAISELGALGIPTPNLLGHATREEMVAIVCEKIHTEPWRPSVRIQAAQVLARLHTLDASSLSKPLRDLLTLSDPRENRTTNGQAPPSGLRTLVHGDYFSKNILPAAEGLCVIDWETFGWGDPMWDLGFLVGADPNLGRDEVEAVIAAYALTAPLNRVRLNWHIERWRQFWQKRSKRKED